MHKFKIVAIAMLVTLCVGDDCSSDFCTCLENSIFCDNLYRTPDLVPVNKSAITTMYINNGYLGDLKFLDEFENLAVLYLMNVHINCTLVEKANVNIQGSGCPGQCKYIYIYISCMLSFSLNF